jgi:copper(I)-binding protein
MPSLAPVMAAAWIVTMRIAAVFIVLALASCGAPPAPSSDSRSSASPSSDAAIASVGRLEIRDTHAAPSPAGVEVAAGYLTIVNRGSEDDRLTGASSARAESVELHSMEMDGAVMRMRPIEGIVLPAGGEAALAPGGNHLMFMGVTQPFAVGVVIPVQWTFERAGTVDIVLPVRRVSGHGH